MLRRAWKRTIGCFTGAILIGTATVRADLNTGLVAYYPFIGNANDASGNGHDGTPLNGATLTADRFGNPNRAYAFDGVDDVITIADAPALNFAPTAQMTVSLWACRVAPTLCMHLVGKRAACGPPFNYQLALNEGNGQGLCFGSGSGGVNTGQGLPSNVWKHLAGTFDGTTFRFYVDGILVGSASGTLGPVVAAPLEIGGSGSCATFCGSIDDVRLYNRALSAAEVQELYHLGQPQNALVSNVRASQRPGTSLVDVQYTLSLSNASSANVSLSISTNNGTRFTVMPAPGSLSGDLTGVLLGSRRITWNASQTLPPGTFGTAFKVRLTAVAGGAPGSGDSPRFTLDLQGLAGGLSVNGRVLDAQTRSPLPDANVSLAGQNRTTSASGEFAFADVSLNSGNTLTVSKSGYATYSDTINVKPGSSVHTAPDTFLQSLPASGTPVVTSIKAKYDGLLLAGLHYGNEYTARVDWNGATPGPVRFYANGQLVTSVPGDGGPLVCTLDVADWFHPSFQPGANQITVIAESAGSAQSNPLSKDVNIIPLPAGLQQFLGNYVLYGDETGLEFAGIGFGFDFEFPDPAKKVVLDLPVVGKFGLELAANASFDYTLPDGDWELAGGVSAEGKQGKRGRRPSIPGLTRYPKMKLYIGNKEVSGSLEVGARGTALLGSGITFDEMFGRGSVSAKLELGRFGLPDLLGPGLSTTLGQIPGVDTVLDTVTIMVYAKPGVDGELIVSVKPAITFKEAEFTGRMGIEAAYEPDLGFAEARFYVGGEPSVTFHYDQATGLRFKELRFRAYAGAEAHAWIFDVGPLEYVFVNKVITPTLDPTAGAVCGAPTFLKVVSGEKGLRPMKRDYLKAGPERFVANQQQAGGTLRDGTRVSKQEAFLTMKGDAVAADEVGAASESKKYELESNGPKQADWTVAENVFPGGRPALAARGTELMLLYIADRGLTNDLQFTEIAWTRFDGTNWSEPLTIRTNTQAEFAPQVAYDGNGDAIAVWECVADPNFNSTNLTDMAAQMEVVWSRWARTNGAWSEPVAFTANSYLDHAPLLCGPMTNGDLLALWTKNEANLLMSTNGVGADTVLWSRWSPASQSWSDPEILATNLSYRLSQSLAGVSNYAVYAWAQDLDGVLTNDSDQEVFYAEYTGSGWGPVKQLTTNNVPDKNVRIAVSPWSGGTSGFLYEGFESGGFSSLPWAFTGDAPWTVQSSIVWNGAYAAASGTVGNNQSSGMALSNYCATGAISFSYKVSSENGYDYIRFYIDGQEQGAWSGSVGWSVATYPVAEGQHTFEWRYTKDGSVSSGSDKAWIDDVSLPIPGPAQLTFAVWQQGTNLVMNRNFSTNTTLVRPNSQTAGFADFSLTFGPAGNLVLVWQEMSQDGSDPYYSAYDPVSGTWSKDARLFADPSLERSFATAWDNATNLNIAFNRVEIVLTNKTVTLEGGGTVTITNVPQPGRVDLAVVARKLIKDLALEAGDFSIQGEDFLPGDALTLSATVRNAGDLAMTNILVEFFDGNPTNGGVLLTNAFVSGWLEGATSAVATVGWVVPAPATNRTIYAIVNRTNAASEFNTNNNAQAVNIGGTDLAVSLVSATPETNGAVRVLAQVHNIGAPRATNSLLAIRREGATNAPLATVEVPALEPGRLAQVALDLPPGTQPAGEAVYRLFADETHEVADVDTNNNTTAFAVNLWIDSDNDGLPDNWMMQYFGHADGQAGDLSRAQDDADGDGMSNLAEYLAGTSPKDASSYLRITSVAAGGLNGVQVVWGSAANKLYAIERSAGVGGGFGFTNIAEHILSTPPANSYVDMTATNGAAFYYRIRVE